MNVLYSFILPIQLVLASSFLSLGYQAHTRGHSIESPSIQQSVSFFLVNSSLKPIPLIIPKVMDPNLSPLSSSAVNLGYGQKIFFKYSGKKYLLLEVGAQITPDMKVDVAKLIKDRKETLDLKD